ncbi:MAG: hypothetical protein Tsb0034_08330 [Ekhidna sp.]
MNTLKYFLLANGLFSILSGLSIIIFNDLLADFLWLANADVILAIIGGVLIAFGLLVLSQVRRTDLLVTLFIISQDTLWVIGTVFLLAFKPISISPNGSYLVASVAFVVCFFGIGQTIGLAQIDQVSQTDIRINEPEMKGLKRIQFERVVDATKKDAWEVVSDVSNYHHVAPNIDSVQIISGANEEGMVRSCSHKTDSWTEVATLWEEGEQYSFLVDTDADDYPYPFKYLKGNWKVIEVSPGKTKIAMTFEFLYRKKFQNVLIHPLLKGKFSKVCDELLDNWEEQLRKINHREM